MPVNHGGRYIIRDGKRERVTGKASATQSNSGPKAEKQKQEKRNG